MATFAGLSSAADAEAAIWAAQGMDGRPGLVTGSDRQEILELGLRPIYRGIHGDDAAGLAVPHRASGGHGFPAGV